jgi:hypothetical protein
VTALPPLSQENPNVLHLRTIAQDTATTITSQVIDFIPDAVHHQRHRHLTEDRMMMTTFLRNALVADAIATAATGILLAAASRWLEGWLDIPATLLFYAGAVLIPFAAFVLYLAAQHQVSRGAVWTVVVCNALWVVDSLLLLASGWIAPSMLGHTFVIAQALVVAVFCELQFAGLKRAAVVAG